MHKPQVSIIVPVYNVEKYIRLCLDSMIAQTFTDWEAILVDDGSMDNSGFICDEYADRDIRVKVYHYKNNGVSSARNRGLFVAQGEFVYFADADDELLPDCLQMLYNNMAEKVDLVTASYLRYLDGDIIPDNIQKNDCVFSVKEFIDAISTYPNARFCERYCVTKLFRKSIIDTHALRFDESLAYREDVYFLYSYVAVCQNTIVGINSPVYKYFRRSSGAAMTHTRKITSHSHDKFFAIEKCYQKVHGLELSHYAERMLSHEMLSAYYDYRELVKNETSDESKQKLKIMYLKLSLYLNKFDYAKLKIKECLWPLHDVLKSFSKGKNK